MMAKILLDPGHGPNDNPGVVLGYREGTAMYDYAHKHLAPILRSTGHMVDITRNTITDNPSLTARGKGAKGFDLFVSLHSNAEGGGGKGTARGVSVYYSVNRKGDAGLAVAMGNAVAGVMGSYLRGAKTRPSETRPGYDYYTVIDQAAQVGCMHVLLVEHGFHTNAGECMWLMDDSNLKRMALGECAVITEALTGQPMPPVMLPLPEGLPPPEVPPKTIETPTLYYGDTGEAIIRLQRLLAAKGYGVVVDGTYGQQTDAAVRAFQVVCFMPNYGICESSTWHMLQ